MKAFAEPVAELRLDQEVLHLAVFVAVERPGVVSTRNVERRFLSESELKSGIGSRRRPIKQIGFNGHLLHARRALRLLGLHRVKPAAQHRKKENGQNFFHIPFSKS